ncbi:MAG: nucleotidyltransferase [Pirellula sp.]
MKLRNELLQITHCLDDAGIDYALCGGLAVAAHGYPRVTKDIDLLIQEKNIDSSHKALAQIAYDLGSGLIPFDTGTDKERRLYRVSKADGRELVTLDLLVVTPVFQEIWMTRELVEVGSKALKIVSRDGWIKMKRIAGRLQDLADIEALERIK